MASVIYLPSENRKTLGSDLGGALGAYAAGEMARRQRNEQAQKVQEFTEAIRTAPDRATAFEIVSNYSGQFTKPEDYVQAFRVVDQFKPASAEEVKPITMYGPDGEPTTVGMTQEQFKRETDPNLNATKYPGMSFTKPDLTDFYTHGEKEGDIRYLGKLPTAKRPEGSMTLQEIAQSAAVRREGRAVEREAASERRHQDRMAQTDENQALAERRLMGVLGRISTAMGDKERNHADGQVKEATRLLAVMSNARILPDGSFSFGDENKAEQYRKQVDYITAAIDADPKILNKPGAAARLASDARRVIVGTEKKADPVVEKPKEGGSISGFIDRITGKGEPKAGPTATGKVTYGKAVLKGYKAGDGKTYPANLIEAAAKQSKMTVEEFARRKGLTKE